MSWQHSLVSSNADTLLGKLCDGLLGIAENSTDAMVVLLYTLLPASPVSTVALLSCNGAPANGDGPDRISALPNKVLHRVVSRLPAKDGARTAVLSKRWTGLWLSAPLVLADAHLLPAGTRRPSRRDATSRALRDTVSAALHAHPGPFRFVSLTSGFMAAVEADRAALGRWFLQFATEGIDELVLVNHPSAAPPVRLPPGLFSCPSFCSLYLSGWEFPDTALLLRGVALPNLVELFLGCVVMKERDLEFVLAVSPVLEIISIFGSLDRRSTARLASCSLRYANFLMTDVGEVAVVDAPALERLIFYLNFVGDRCRGRKKMEMRIKIGHAPKLRALGFLQPGVCVLEIGNTVIKHCRPERRLSPSTTVPSLRVLSLHVHFEVSNEVKLLPSLLRCFPSIKMLCVESVDTSEPTANLNRKFWQDTAPIECIQSHLEILNLREFRGEQREIDFLMFVAENARALQQVCLSLAFCRTRAARAESHAKLKILRTAKWASGGCKVHVFEG